MLNMSKALYELGDKIRRGSLAYLYCHKELLENEFYKCAQKMLMYAEAKKFAKSPVNVAFDLVKGKIEIYARCAPPEEIEGYKKDVDYLVDIIKRYDIASTVKTSRFFEC